MTEVQYGPHPAPAPLPEPVKKKRKWILPTAMLVGGLIIGSASAGTAASKPAPTPAVATPAPVETKTVTETVEVEVTPQVCIEALDKAGAVVAVMAKVPPLASDAIRAAAIGDSVTLDSVTRKVKVVNTEMDDLKGPLGDAVDECRAKAK